MPEVVNLDQSVKAAAERPVNTRVSVGASPTFGGATVPTLLPALLTQTSAESLSFSSVDVTQSGSAAIVAKGAAKPAAASIAVTARTIPKISAKADLNFEDYWQSESVISAVLSVLFSSCAVEVDKATNAAFDAATAAAVPAADWIAAIAGGQAAVSAAGGSPNLVYLPASVWPALVTEIASSAGLTTPSDDAVMSLLGSRIVLSPEGVGAFVLSIDAAVHAVRDRGYLIDTLSGSGTNAIKVVVDAVEASFVQNPAWIAAIAVGP